MRGMSLAGSRSLRLRTCVGWASGAILVVAALTACSSSGDSTTGSSEGASRAANIAANLDEAKGLVAKFEGAMTSFSLPALKTAPPQGKKIALVVNNIPESHELMLGMQDGAKALGWTTIPIVYDPTSAIGLQNAFAQAVQDKPDGVITLAVNTTAYTQAAKQLADKGIPLVTSNTTDPMAPPVISNVSNGDQYLTSGRLAAAYVVAQKGADADVALFNIPSFPVLTAFESGFKAEFNRLCPICKYKSVPVQAGDIGTKVPAQVVSTVQADPKINFAVMGFGAVATGVSAALRTASVSGVNIIGTAPSLQNLSDLKNGTENMWIAYPLHGIGWKSIDALARHFNHESTSVDDSAPTPYQILTKADVPDPVALPEVENYEQQFKQLWHVG
jgi:ribose transport system substrate-binding protein